MTIITLSNGKKVGNFSSPHPFIFEDGSILPAVSPEESERLKVNFREISYGNKLGDIGLEFELSGPLMQEMIKWQQLHISNKVDVVFCPLPMITALHTQFGRNYVINSPFRAIRIEDRIKKLVSIHKQCI
jgi:hypothetical protein